MRRVFIAIVALASISCAEPVSYFREVRPVLRANCTGCHRPGKSKGGLDLTSVASILKGGEAGPMKAGQGADAEIFKQIAGAEPEMPKDAEALDADEIGVIRRWIDEGAKDDTPSDPGEASRLSTPPVYRSAPSITSIAWSPDGSVLAAAAWHEVVLRSGDGAMLLGRLVGDSPRVEAIAFSPDGKRIAFAGGAPSEFGEVQIWDIAERRLVRSVKTSTDCVFGVAWSPDGRRLSVGCTDKLVRVFDAGDGRELMRCDNHADWVLATAWSRDGSRLVSAGRDKAIKLIDPATGHLVDDIAQPREPILAVARHPIDDMIAFGGDNGMVRLHKIAPRGGRLAEGDNKEESSVREFERIAGPAHALAFSPDGSLLAVTGARGETRVWSTADGKRIAQVSCESPLYALAFAADGKAFATAGADGHIRIYDSRSGNAVGDFVPVPIESR